MIAPGAATDPDTVKAYVAAFESAGCDELIIFPSSSDPSRSSCSLKVVGR